MHTISSDELYERDAALAELANRLDKARRSQGSMVFITGEAGIGKTALVRHFAQSQPDLKILAGFGEPTASARPLGIIHDISLALPGTLRAQLGQSAQPWQLYEALVADLARTDALPLIWVEDVHWADQATVELLRYLGRRCAAHRMLVVLTLRSHEPRSDTIRKAIVSGLPLDHWHEIALQRLSEQAVAAIAADKGHREHGLYTLTKGNPLFLVSMLRWSGTTVPESLAQLAQQRLAAMPPPAVALIQALSTHPDRIDRPLMAQMPQATPEALSACIDQRWLLVQDGAWIFEHELLRRAVLDSIAPDERRRLHRQMLDRPMSMAGRVHHALNAQDWTLLRALIPEAVEESVRAKSYREAADFLALGLQHTGPEPHQRARWLDQMGWMKAHSGDHAGGRAAYEQARALWRELGDSGGLLHHMALVLRWPQRTRAVSLALSAEDIQAALAHRQHADEAFDRAILQLELSRQLAVAGQMAEAIAIVAAVGALVPRIGSATERAELRCWISWFEHYYLMQGPSQDLDDVALQADRHGLDILASQVMLCKAMVATMAFDHPLAARLRQDTADFAARRDQTPLYADVFRIVETLVNVFTGPFGDGIATCEALIARWRGPAPFDHAVHAMLRLLRARTGIANQQAGIETLLANARPTLNVSNYAYALGCATEVYWIEGNDRRARECAEQAWALTRTATLSGYRLIAALWAARTGALPAEEFEALPELRALAGSGGWQQTHEPWLRRGMPYLAALALAEGDRDDRRKAIDLLQGMGARGAAARLQATWAAEGDGYVPRGARSSTQSRPAGLTQREWQVLGLLKQGLSNAEIAGQLHRSQRTVEHHLSAVFAKIGVRSRLEAIVWARSHAVD